MRIIVWIFLSFSLNATEIPLSIVDLQPTDREGLLSLEVDNYDKAYLDCDSFLHGLSFKNNSTDEFFFLYEPECIEIYEFITKELEENKFACVYIDLENQSFRLDSQTSDCL